MAFALVKQGFDHNGTRYNAGDVIDGNDAHVNKLVEEGSADKEDLQGIAWAVNTGHPPKKVNYDRVKYELPKAE